MRITLNIDDDLLDRAADLTGTREKTALVRMGLQALIHQQSGERLAALGGSEPNLESIARRRSQPDAVPDDQPPGTGSESMDARSTT